MKTNKLPKWTVWASLLAALPFTACAPADDAGEVSFVIEATQMVLGRKPRGTAEVQSLLGVLQDHGRDAVIDVLMEEPDFVEYWLPVLTDAMQVQQRGIFTQDAVCFNDPIYMTYMVDGHSHACATGATSECKTRADALADHIRNHLPKNRSFDPDGDGTTNGFNMNDALRAALIADDLHVAWRPWLFVLAGKKDPMKAGVLKTRDNFMVSAFNVQTGCISCHSATYSTTEVYQGTKYEHQYEQNTWDRTAVLGYDLERTAFGKRAALDLTNDPTCWKTGDEPNERVLYYDVYQHKCAQCHGSDGTRLPEVSYEQPNHQPPLEGKSPRSLTARVPVLTEDEIVAQITDGGGHMLHVDLDGDGLFAEDDPDEEPCARNIASFLRKQLGGYEDFGRYVDYAQFVGSSGPWGLTSCGISWTEDLVCDSSREYMFAGQARECTDVANVTGVLKSGLTALAAEPGAPVTATADPDLPSTSSPDVSVAMLLVQNIADDLLFEVTSNRTTVAHGLPRTTTQAMALQYMVSHMLVEDGGTVRISLKSGLKQAILSTLFNRTTPAYDLEMHFNPWPAHDPGSSVPADPEAGDDRNGLGDLVHRRSPNQLLWSLHQDLGWTAPPIMIRDRTTHYPTEGFENAIGRYQSPTMPQNPVWDLNSFTMLESQVGLCYSEDTAQDWIWQLANGTFNGAVQACTPTCTTPTIRQLLLSTKDRLIQDPVFDPNPQDGVLEVDVTRALATNVLGSAPAACSSDILNCRATLWSKATINVMLRKYCSGVLMSPAYLMANLPTVRTPRALPAVTVCLTGELCKKPDLDSHYAATLCSLKYTCN